MEDVRREPHAQAESGEASMGRTEHRALDDGGSGTPWRLAAGAALLAAAGLGVWWWQSRAPETPPAPLPRAETPAPAQSFLDKEEPAEHPLPAPPADAPLPALAASDTLMLPALLELAGNPRVQDLLQLPGIVRRVVATVDALPREKSMPAQWPLKPLGGALRVSGAGDALALDGANAARYATHVKLLESVDMAKLVALYVRTYPLFQQAYAELGYPKRYFNDRLLQVIDHLLATPQPAGALRLSQPKLVYEFADAELQSLSAGQKTLLRMGPDNAARVKARLRALRDEILRNSEKR